MKAYKLGAVQAAIPGGIHLGSKLNLIPYGYIRINSKNWSQRNLDLSLTPNGTTLIEMPLSSNTDKILNGNFDSAANWSVPSQWVIANGVATFNGATSNHISQGLGAIRGKWVKIQVTINSITGSLVLFDTSSGLGYASFNTAGTKTFFRKVYGETIALRGTGGSIIEIDNVVVKQIGWAGLSELYTGLLNQGYTEANALAEVICWSNHANNVALDAVYGKIYNGFAKNKLQSDIDINGTYGFHVSTEAEITALAEKGGYALKETGTEHWLTNTGTNTTKFSALGAGTRNSTDGSFSAIKETTAFWCADSDKVLVLNHADNSAVITEVTKDFGAYIRLVQDDTFPIPLA